jgi:hypothetical protein
MWLFFVAESAPTQARTQAFAAQHSLSPSMVVALASKKAITVFAIRIRGRPLRIRNRNRPMVSVAPAGGCSYQHG